MLVEFEESQSSDGRLADALGAVASPVRLALLRHVRTPKTLWELKIRSSAPATDGGQERILARQTVKEHLERLLEVGVVTARETERDYGSTVEYIVNHQTLYALAEEFRSLAHLRPSYEPDGVTIPSTPAGASDPLEGPCLLLVKGLEEGKVYDLTPPANARREWVIGRQRGLDVSLDFDPFVSMENAMIVWEGGRHHLQDLPASRNGTLLNFRSIPKGGRVPLRSGDVVGVGRSLLTFRA